MAAILRYNGVVVDSQSLSDVFNNLISRNVIEFDKNSGAVSVNIEFLKDIEKIKNQEKLSISDEKTKEVVAKINSLITVKVRGTNNGRYTLMGLSKNSQGFKQLKKMIAGGEINDDFYQNLKCYYDNTDMAKTTNNYIIEELYKTDWKSVYQSKNINRLI